MSPERWARVKAVLDSALSLSPNEREGYLSTACAEDSSLRFEVESLLQADQQSPDSFMKTGAARSRLMPGAKLGGYEIIELIGDGGMGEVYRARDLQLRRDVAIKALPPLFALDTDRLRRFEQEARATAALNHPNILAVHHFGTHEGQPFIVSELLQGHTLREELRHGALPLRSAIDYALQVARGLAAAHEQAIVHRDLKPENIFLAKDGQIKILDFGLAKLHPPTFGQETHTSPETETGMIMGTLAYMSPEQLRGREVDPRADIFAFGAILYELISGRSLFRKESAADTQSAILKEEPPSFAEAQVNAPPALERITRRCLEKTPERRFQSALDVEFALDAIWTPSDIKTGEDSFQAPTRRRVYVGWLVAALIVAGIAILLISQAKRPQQVTSQPAARFLVNPPEKVSLLNLPVVSPNGQHVVFIGVDNTGKRQLWVRSLDSLAAQTLPGTDDAQVPYWSPDSNSIAFYAQGALRKVDLWGGVPQVIWEQPALAGGAWNVNGIIVTRGGDNRLYRLAARGSEPKPITELDPSRKEVWHGFPTFLPDGDHFLYLAGSSVPENFGIYVASLSSPEKKLLVSGQGIGMAAYSSGFLLFARRETLMAQSFDIKNLEFRGSPTSIATPIWRYSPMVIGVGAFSVSQNGVLVYRDPGFGPNTELVWYDRSGKKLTTLADHGYFTSPYLSPDGKKLAVANGYPGHRDIWVYDLEKGVKTRLTFEPGDDLNAVWSADSQNIFYTSDRRGPRELYQQAANDPKAADLVFSSSDHAVSIHDMSPDGRFVLYDSGAQDFGLLPLFGDHKPTIFDKNGPQMASVRFSPNGRYVAYSSTESGKLEVYVRTFPEPTGKWEISTDGGGEPMWRGDGKELFYLAGGKVMAVDVKTDSSGFQAGVPRVLFEHPRLLRFPTSTILRNRYVVTKDGQRFLFVAQPEPLAEGFNVLTNWTTELKK